MILAFFLAFAADGDKPAPPPPPPEPSRLEYVLVEEATTGQEIVQVRQVRDVGAISLDPELIWEQSKVGDFDGNGDDEVALISRSRPGAVGQMWYLNYGKDKSDLIKGPVLDDEWRWIRKEKTDILSIRVLGTEANCRYKLVGDKFDRECDDIPRHDPDAPVPAKVRASFEADDPSCPDISFTVTERSVDWVFPPLGTAKVTSAHEEDRTMLVTDLRGRFNTLVFPDKLRDRFQARFGISPLGPFQTCTLVLVPTEGEIAIDEAQEQRRQANRAVRRARKQRKLDKLEAAADAAK